MTKINLPPKGSGWGLYEHLFPSYAIIAGACAALARSFATKALLSKGMNP